MLRELSHRLRAPLATAHGYATLMEQHVAGAAPSELDGTRLTAWAASIQRDVERASELLADLSRLRTIPAALRPTAVDLRRLTGEAVGVVVRDTERRVELEPGEPTPYTGDPALLGRAIYHSIVFAIECGRNVRVRVVGGPSGGTIESRWDTRAAWPPEHDPWMTYCRAVAGAHGGGRYCVGTSVTVQLGRAAGT